QKPAEIKQPFSSEPIKASPMPLQEFPAPAPLKETPAVETSASSKPETNEPKKETPMPMPEPATNMNQNSRSANGGMAPKLSSMASQPAANESYKQESKPVRNQDNTVDNDAVECDLRVANKIIDEAIRNEMRLSDVVRRIIELPVADQQAVQIPVTL